MESNKVRKKKEIILDKLVRAGFVQRPEGSKQIICEKSILQKNKTL